MRTFMIAAAVAATAAMAPGAWAQHGQPPHGAPSDGGSTSLQGDTRAWSENPYMHAFYDLTKETLGAGAAPLDFETYREKSYAIFRDFGVSMGVGAEGMVDHLKDIPGQMVDIVKDDPSVIDSYENFRIALAGPD